MVKTLTVNILTLLVNGTKKGACFNMSFARVFSIRAWGKNKESMFRTSGPRDFGCGSLKNKNATEAITWEMKNSLTPSAWKSLGDVNCRLLFQSCNYGNSIQQIKSTNRAQHHSLYINILVKCIITTPFINEE